MRDRPSEEASGPGWVEIGHELARAVEADERHRLAHGDMPSPLRGITYDPSRGELDLHRFVESPADELLHDFTAGYAPLPADRREAVRASLTLDDFYNLLTFAKRSALAALRSGDATQARAGLTALTAIDAERVDWRDVSVAAALLSYVMRDQRAELFLEASARSDRTVGEILQGLAQEPVESLEDWGYRAVATAGGRVFFEDYGERYEPAIDLIELALRIAAVIEHDLYRVTSIGVGNDVPEVWLRSGDQPAVSRAVESLAGCVGIQADLRAGSHLNAEDQQFRIFLAEAASQVDASVVAEASEVDSGADHQALGLATDNLCCLVIARSFVEGVPAFERPGALERFRPALAGLLEKASSTKNY